MRRAILILTFFLFLTSFITCIAAGTMHKEVSAVSVDGFNIKATFDYPKIKGKKEFSTVVLLHSLGYSSQWWEDLPKELLNSGYAVLNIDLRGHGESVYNSQLVRTSWKNMTNKAYAKYPDDVLAIIDVIKSENSKKKFFDNWAIVGADIGANTAVLLADKVAVKPKTIVMLSPTIDVKGLYIPVSLAHLGGTDCFAISGTNDFDSEKVINYLKKFAQAEFVAYKSESKSTGVLMLKNDNSLTKIITTWIKDYLN